MPERRPRSDAAPDTPDTDTPQPGPIRSTEKFSAANEKLRQQIEGVYQGVGALVMMGDAPYGLQIIEASTAISIAWVELAETNPKVKQFLNRFVSGGAAGQVIALHLTLLLPLLAKRGLLPGELANFVQGTQNGNSGDPAFN